MFIPSVNLSRSDSPHAAMSLPHALAGVALARLCAAAFLYCPVLHVPHHSVSNCLPIFESIMNYNALLFWLLFVCCIYLALTSPPVWFVGIGVLYFSLYPSSVYMLLLSLCSVPCCLCLSPSLSSSLSVCVFLLSLRTEPTAPK